jgi:DNA repair exonuclease SbcCD ATPase subunit
MLYIKTLKFKNILSSGNIFTELNFDDSNTTLIRGNSGQGKSLIITALVFGLYGRSNRGTTKKQLVNTTNKKDCVVEVEFQVSGKTYLVKRGTSPNIFEIYVDGKLQDQLSAMKDQQKYLEQNILKMSMKTFMSIVVLGSNNYIPFMQLSASDRRDLVEEILDIKIFSTMNTILKEKIKSVDRKLKEIEFNINSTEEKIEMQRGFIQKLKTDGNLIVDTKKANINDIQKQISVKKLETEVLLKDLTEHQENLSNISFSSKKIKGLLDIGGKFSQKKATLLDQKLFFEHNETCPTCNQNLQVEFTNSKILEINSELDKLDSANEELLVAISREEELESAFNTLTDIIQQFTFNISKNQTNIKLLESNAESLQNEIDEIQHKIADHNSEELELEKLIQLKDKLNLDYGKCKDALHYFEFSHLLIKDGGVKSKIIEKYLPIINTQINRYLQMMDLYINFNLDEDFKETINTPLHQGFSYSSFSEGEKQRINLATILAWREVSRMKNSANCNLVFFDETLDSSLDASGIDDFLKIINYVVQDSNVFVISHRDGFDDRFNRVIEVKKVNGFSKLFY